MKKRLICLLIGVCFLLVGCDGNTKNEAPIILNEKLDTLSYSAKSSVAQLDNELLDKITVTFDSGSRKDNITTFYVKIINGTDKVFSGELSFKFRQENGDYVDSDIVRAKSLQPTEQYLGEITCADAPSIELTYIINDYKFEEVVTDSLDANFIQGSNAYDVTVSLEELDFPSFDRKDSADSSGYVYTSDTTVDNVDMRCTLRSTKNYEITYAQFAINSAFEKSLISVGYDYLAFCASLPYDLSDAEKANQWVLDNIGSVFSPETSTSTEIGGVKFELSGTKLAKNLEVSPA